MKKMVAQCWNDENYLLWAVLFCDISTYLHKGLCKNFTKPFSLNGAQQILVTLARNI